MQVTLSHRMYPYSILSGRTPESVYARIAISCLIHISQHGRHEIGNTYNRNTSYSTGYSSFLSFSQKRICFLPIILKNIKSPLLQRALPIVKGNLLQVVFIGFQTINSLENEFNLSKIVIFQVYFKIESINTHIK